MSPPEGDANHLGGLTAQEQTQLSRHFSAQAACYAPTPIIFNMQLFHHCYGSSNIYVYKYICMYIIFLKTVSFHLVGIHRISRVRIQIWYKTPRFVFKSAVVFSDI